MTDLITASESGRKTWLSPAAARREADIAATVDVDDLAGLGGRVHELARLSRTIHDKDCINLNPASNLMNPRAEALLAEGLSTRASLGHPGDKYEMGLEAIEEIEVIAERLVREVFGTQFAELRVASGSLANLYAFMATCRPGDAIIVPPASIGGHVTHRDAGAAGLYGLQIHECPVDGPNFTIDLDALRDLAGRVRPALITIGTSLNLVPHPIGEIRSIADDHGAKVMFDAAHACGLIAGKAWPDPLANGAHLMTMSTYKSLGGPAGGLVLTNDADLASRLDAIAYPGLTANFDVSKTAALAVTMLDWLEFGRSYAAAMIENAVALADALVARGLPVHHTAHGPTMSHQLAIDATGWGGGHAASQLLRSGNLLACAIGLPGLAEGAGLRLGTPEITRFGMTTAHMDELATVVSDCLAGTTGVAQRVSEMRRRFTTMRYVLS